MRDYKLDSREEKKSTRGMVKMIERLQLSLREQLLEELWEDKESLEEAILQPDAYSYKFQTYKEKYLDKLCDLQRIISELYHLDKAKAMER